MIEQSEVDKYVKCYKCTCKYINDDEHIKEDFGYNRLNERFKTCSKCRDKHKACVTKRKKEIAEEIMNDDSKRCSRCLIVYHVKEYGEYKGVVVVDGKYCNQQLHMKLALLVETGISSSELL